MELSESNLRAIFDEARKQGIATDPIKLDRLIQAVGSSLTVDTNGIALADLVFGLKGIRPQKSMVEFNPPGARRNSGKALSLPCSS